MKKSILNPILLLVLPMLSSLAQSQQRLASHVSVADTCYTNCPDDNHPHAIDLGLPSGTKWACCNVGATVPEGYGGYYSWGETEEKDSYDKTNYLHYDVSAGEYMDIGQYICGTDYDVAHVRWGESWQMPMYEQIKELVDNCSCQWTDINGIAGQLFTSKINGACVFLPATGNRYQSAIHYQGVEGDYWSATRLPSTNSLAYSLGFYNSGATSERISYPHSGLSVRPVVNAEKELVDLALSTSSPVTIKQGEQYEVQVISGNSLYSVWSGEPEIASVEMVGNEVIIKAYKAGVSIVTVTDAMSRQTASIKVIVVGLFPSCPDDNHPHAIDLGLPSGTKWACCNLGGTSPEDRGEYYAWGETEIKDHYDSNNYQYYDPATRNCLDIGESICGTEHDVARAKWGSAWQMPSLGQIQELMDNCTSLWTEFDGIKGRLFISKENEARIFMPIDKDDRQEDCWAHGEKGYYWSGTLSPDDDCAYDFFFDDQIMRWAYEERLNGWFVRPVAVTDLNHTDNPFAVEGKVWHMRHDSPIPHNVSYDFDYFIQGDTLIATNECKKLYAYNEDGKQQTVYKMALYEQEGKVFFIPEDSETPYLLYDFQSNAGDTVTVFECNHPEHPQKDMAVLEVNRFSVNGVERRCERVGLQESSNRSAGWWIEGIGSELGPLNTSGFGMVGNSNYLICCELAGDTIFSLGEFQNMLLNLADGYAHMLREGNTWHYHFMIEHADGVKDAWFDYEIADSYVWNGKAYYQMTVSESSHSADEETGKESALTLDMREENGRVYVSHGLYLWYLQATRDDENIPMPIAGNEDYIPYHANNEGELILYDFNMEVGDSYAHVDGYDDVFVVTTDTIETQDSKKRKRITLSNGLVIVEGIGCVNSTGGLIFYLNPLSRGDGEHIDVRSGDMEYFIGSNDPAAKVYVDIPVLSGIRSPKVGNESEERSMSSPIETYLPSGQKIKTDTPSKGIRIIRYSDGTVKKVYSK